MAAKRSLPAFAEVVRTVELEPIAAASGPALKLRIEVLKRGRRFGVQVYRRELLRVRPSAGKRSSEADEEVLVTDVAAWHQIDEATAGKALQKALLMLRAQITA